jgi:hypothetical protein
MTTVQEFLANRHACIALLSEPPLDSSCQLFYLAEKKSLNILKTEKLEMLALSFPR